MKKLGSSKSLMIVILIYCFGFSKVQATEIIYNDGIIHTINHEIHTDFLRIYNNSQNEPTAVNLVTNGLIGGYLYAYDNSLINISGGLIQSSLSISDDAILTMSGGSVVHDLVVQDFTDYCRATILEGSIGDDLKVSGHNVVLTMSGGSVWGDLETDYHSDTYISGGFIDGTIYANLGSTITISGSDFKINGSPVYGEIYNPPNYSPIHGTLTGRLDSGESLNNDFYIYPNSSIVLIPEPATLLLLGLGMVMLRKKR